MLRTVEQFYRRLRHDIRVRLNFARNNFMLRKLRVRLKRESPERRLVAVMLLEHLGDIVACEPVAHHLRKRDPDAFIVWCVKKTYRELIDTNPLIDKTVVVHCLSERLMLSNSGVFDEVVDLHLSDRYCSLCSRPLKSKNNSVVSLNTYFKYGGILSAFSQSAGLPPLDGQPNVYVPQDAVRRVEALHLPERFVAVNCSSNTIEKDWPEAKWKELSEKIMKNYGLSVVEIGILPLLSGINDPNYVDLCNRLSILESAEVIRRARLFVGIDSGPAHLANAVGTAGVILMGSYLGFTRYMPFSGRYGKGEGVAIVHNAGPAADIPVDTVFAAVKETFNNGDAGSRAKNG